MDLPALRTISFLHGNGIARLLTQEWTGPYGQCAGYTSTPSVRAGPFLCQHLGCPIMASAARASEPLLGMGQTSERTKHDG